MKNKFLLYNSLYLSSENIVFLIEKYLAAENTEKQTAYALAALIKDFPHETIELLKTTKQKDQDKKDREAQAEQERRDKKEREEKAYEESVPNAGKELVEAVAAKNIGKIDAFFDKHKETKHPSEYSSRSLIADALKLQDPTTQNTPLHLAIINKIPTDTAKKLIQIDAIGTKNADDKTPLMLALKHDNTDLAHAIIECFINNVPNANAPFDGSPNNPNGLGLIKEKVSQGHSYSFRTSYVKENDQEIDTEGNTVLHHAVIKKQAKLVELLAQKMPIEYLQTQNKAKKTAYQLALEHYEKDGNTDLITFFVRHPVICEKNANKKTLLIIAQEKNDVASIELAKKIIEVYNAAAKNQLNSNYKPYELRKSWLMPSYGKTDPEDEEDEQKNSALHRAANKGQLELVQLLVKIMDPSYLQKTNNKNKTALQLAEDLPANTPHKTEIIPLLK